MIWSLFKDKPEAKTPEHKPIVFGGWQYAPQPDITAYELAMLSPVFGAMMVRADVKPYIEKNELTRHFIIPIKEQDDQTIS
jgi:hypothetical protein